MKSVEREVIQAAASGSRTLAVRALAAHPLVDSATVARRLLDSYRSRIPAPAYLR